MALPYAPQGQNINPMILQMLMQRQGAPAGQPMQNAAPQIPGGQYGAPTGGSLMGAMQGAINSPGGAGNQTVSMLPLLLALAKNQQASGQSSGGKGGGGAGGTGSLLGKGGGAGAGAAGGAAAGAGAADPGYLAGGAALGAF